VVAVTENVRTSIDPERRQCKAKSKRSQERCRRFCAPGWDVCYYHGQNSPRGVVNANWRGGKYSKVLPAGLTEDFRRLANDPELLSLREELGLVDLRLIELVEGLKSKNVPATWQHLKDMATNVRLGIDSRPPLITDDQKLARIKTLEMQLNGILMQIDKGATDSEAWTDLFAAMQMRTKLVEAERRRVVDAHRVLTAEEVRNMMVFLADTIRLHVSNDRERRAVFQAISTLLATPSRAELPETVDAEYQIVDG
jgi:hypothetical protein